MSAEAIAYLRQIWGKLTFAKVNRVIAREPEDVLYINIPRTQTGPSGYVLFGHTDYTIDSKRTADIPQRDLWKAKVSWRHYYGFTDDGVYFQKADYCKLDLDVSITLDWGEWGNHRGGWSKPEIGSLIAGEVTEGTRGKRFTRWFICPPQLKVLIDAVLYGTTMNENELATKLVGSDFPDTYWAIARLVLFDNVQAFVDDLKDPRPTHPCFGMEYVGEGHPINGLSKVYWSGMYLMKNAAQYVRDISQVESDWWTKFCQLAEAQGVYYSA